MPTAEISPQSFTAWGPTRRWWILNPGPRVGICFDEGLTDFVFAQRTYQFKSNMAMSPRRSIDAVHRGRPWRAMLVSYDANVAVQYDGDWNRPVGVYPAWSAQQPDEDLWHLCRNYPRTGRKIGNFMGSVERMSIIRGQQRVIVITNQPKDNWEDFYRRMVRMKREFAHITFHFHGGKSMTRTMGTGVDSFDHPVTQRWEGGIPSLILPNGKEYRAWSNETDREEEHPDKWSALIGLKATSIPRIKDRERLSRSMYIFNLRSLKWAFANHEKLWSLRVADESVVDADSPDTEWIPVDLTYRPRRSEVGDQWACDVCSLYTTCLYSRPGGICVVPDTPGRELVELYGTSSVANVKEVLAKLLEVDAGRLQRGLTKESLDMTNGRKVINRRGEEVIVEIGLDPEVTKLSESIFKRTIQLLELSQGRPGKPPVLGGIIDANEGIDPTELAERMRVKAIEMGLDPETLTDQDIKLVLSSLHDEPPASLPDDDRGDSSDDEEDDLI